jgi:hypothetical protein
LKIREHHAARIIEVIYQASALTPLEHAAYTIKMKQTIEKQEGAWGLLVDQRPLTKLDDKLKEKMLALYGYALKRGMAFSARIVKSPRDALRLTEIIQDTELKPVVRIFNERKPAFDWLVESLRIG